MPACAVRSRWKRWTGASVGWVSLKLMSSEIAQTGRRRRQAARKGTLRRTITQARRRSGGVEDPMHAPKLHAREPRGPAAFRCRKGAERWEKARSYKTHRNGSRESSSGIVPMKRWNAGQGGPKETVEGRLLAKENAKPPIPAPDSVPNEWANIWQVGVRQEPMLRGA